MPDRAVLDRANDVLERLFLLSDAITDARAFRALLEDLHARDLTIVTGPQADAVTMVRAAILRSAVGAVMAVLDPEDNVELTSCDLRRADAGPRAYSGRAAD